MFYLEWDEFVFVFVIANISLNNHICFHICPYLANQNIFVWDTNIFIFVFAKKFQHEYICIHIRKKKVNANIFVFVIGPENRICHTLISNGLILPGGGEGVGGGGEGRLGKKTFFVNSETFRILI